MEAARTKPEGMSRMQGSPRVVRAREQKVRVKTMTGKLHKSYRLNMKRAASAETKTSEQGYVVKFGGNRYYAHTYSDARKYRENLMNNGWLASDIKIVNIAKQPGAARNITKVKKTLFTHVGAKFSGGGLTGGELASMVLGRMGEATTFTFRRAYATDDMRRQAQRALMHKVRAGRCIVTDEVKKALALKIPGKRKVKRKA